MLALQTNLHLQHQEKESTTRTLRAQIQDLHEKLKRVGETEVSIEQRTMMYYFFCIVIVYDVWHVCFIRPYYPVVCVLL